MNSKILFRQIQGAIATNDPPGEKEAMAYLLLESVSISKTDVMAGKEILASNELLSALWYAVGRLNDYEPIQYVLGEAWFYGRKFQVDKNVLIPRPETEELVRYVIDVCKEWPAVKAVDFGTGSGCLAITLALELEGSIVYATDVSRGALKVAQANAERLGASIILTEHDLLHDGNLFSDINLVVSNPPYITPEEQSTIHPRVMSHEPCKALFTQTADPLQYYRLVLSLARQMMRPGGFIAVEINERYGKQVTELFHSSGFEKAILVKDMSGKDRIVAATHP